MRLYRTVLSAVAPILAFLGWVETAHINFFNWFRADGSHDIIDATHSDIHHYMKYSFSLNEGEEVKRITIFQNGAPIYETNMQTLQPSVQGTLQNRFLRTDTIPEKEETITCWHPGVDMTGTYALKLVTMDSISREILNTTAKIDVVAISNCTSVGGHYLMDQSACGYQFQYKCTNPVFPPSSMDVSAFITTAGDHKALLRFPPKSFVVNPLEDGRFEFSFDEFLNMSPDIPEEFVFHYHVYQNGRLVSNITEVLKRGDNCQGMSTGSEMELITAEPSPVTVFQAAPSGQVPNMSAGITIRGGPLGIDFITFPPEEKYIPHDDEFYNDIEDLPQTNPPEETQNAKDRTDPTDQTSSHEPQVEIGTTTAIEVEAQTEGPENSVTVETFDEQPINENEIPETPMPQNAPELPGLTDTTEIFAVTYGPAETVPILHTNGETDEPHKDEFQVPSTTPKSYITTTPSATLYSGSLMTVSEAIGLSSQPIEFPTQSPVSEIQSADNESTTSMGTSTLASENSDSSRFSSLTNSQPSSESTIKPKILELQTVMSNVPSMVPNSTDGPSDQQENSTDHQILDSHNSSVPSNQLNSVAPKYASSSSPTLSVQQSTIVAATEVSGSPEDQSSTAPSTSKVPTTHPLPGSPPSNPGPGSNPGGGGNWQMAQVWRSGKATLQPR